ncbi:MAG: hypothetical protein IJS58_08440 [Bacilli bacterium]|nr:hypothetical protein [Bacilli bacterium]
MRKKIMSIVILFLILNSIFIIGCSNTEVEDKKEFYMHRIEEQIEIIIPQDANLIGAYSSQIFMHGRHPSYCVFQFDQEPEEFLLNNGFQEKKSDMDREDQYTIEKLEKKIINELKTEIRVNKMQIPKDDLITFEESYLFIYHEGLQYYLIYYPSDYKLIVYIQGR